MNLWRKNTTKPRHHFISHLQCLLPTLPAAHLPLLLEALDGDAVLPLNVGPHGDVVHLDARVHGGGAEAGHEVLLHAGLAAVLFVDRQAVRHGYSSAASCCASNKPGAKKS